MSAMKSFTCATTSTTWAKPFTTLTATFSTSAKTSTVDNDQHPPLRWRSPARQRRGPPCRQRSSPRLWWYLHVSENVHHLTTASTTSVTKSSTSLTKWIGRRKNIYYRSSQQWRWQRRGKILWTVEIIRSPSSSNDIWNFQFHATVDILDGGNSLRTNTSHTRRSTTTKIQQGDGINKNSKISKIS